MKRDDTENKNESSSDHRSSKNEKAQENQLNSNRRSKHKSLLRKRNFGIGIDDINIEKPETTENKKIRYGVDFQDDFDDDKLDTAEKVEINKSEYVPDDGVDDNNDNEVEAVKSSDAKQEFIKSNAAERATKREALVLTQKRKRKKPKREQVHAKSVKDDSDLDDTFLEMVDSERRDDKRIAKLKTDALTLRKKNMSRHTTFVSKDDEVSFGLKPSRAEYNIDVVVLPELQKEKEGNEATWIMRERQKLALNSRMGTKPSQAALLFSRSRGSHLDSISIRNEIKQKGTLINENCSKRSRKMKYNFKQGEPAITFLVKR